MGVLRIERAAPTGLTAKVTGVAWRSFDLQLFVYAGLLAVLGLTMAYSNSTGPDGLVMESGTTFARGLMWAVISLVGFTAATLFDYTWLKSFAWPLYLVNLGLLVATLILGNTDEVASARWISIFGFQFQFSELAKVVMVLILARYLAEPDRNLDSPDRHARRRPDHRATLAPGDAPARPRDLALPPLDPDRDPVHGGCEPPLDAPRASSRPRP